MSDHPFSALTPDLALDALESAGLRCDGRMLALNSFEIRVYQMGQEEGPPVIAKFYRPARWSNAAILEEHAYTLELAEREIPVVAPLVLQGRTLHEFAGFHFAVYPRQGGRPPELDDADTLEWMGRFIGRIHAVGSTQAFVHRPALDIDSFGTEPCAYLLANNWIPPELLGAWESVSAQALEGVRHCFARAGDIPTLRAR